MEKIKFKITVHKKQPIELSLETMRKYPVHTHNMIEIKEFINVYTFEPAKNFDKTAYINVLAKKLNLKYSNSSSTCIVEFLTT